MSEDHSQVVEKKRRQRDILDYLKATGNANEALDIVGVPKSTYMNWRSQEPDFRVLAEQALQIGQQHRRLSKISTEDFFDPEAAKPDIPPFREFRERYVGRHTWPHQDPIVDAWADPSNLMVIVLAPPSSGKDTTAGDIVLHESVRRDKRVAWIMETGTQSEKRLGRLERYFWDRRVYDLIPQGPLSRRPEATLMEDFGLFRHRAGLRYPDGSTVASTKWTAQELYFLGRDNEADPNVWATGIQGAMYGARIDIAVLSDIFTPDNQWSPAEREKQWSWLMETFMSRLDEGGRSLYLGTRVGEMDNWGRLLEEFTAGVQVIDQQGWYTKYANGVATVIYPAIQTDPDGNDVSYWPEYKPLRSSLIKDRDGQVDMRFVDELTVDEHRTLSRQGYKRQRGLYEHRDRLEGRFQTIYQQSPVGSTAGEFNPALLDHCDDYSRSWGVRKPGSTLVLGIDPAIRAGAAWILLEYDGATITPIDEFYGENIGTQGLREKLLVDPISRWFPKYAVYEGNRESSVLEHPEVISALDSSRTSLVVHNTNAGNRGVGELRVAAMSIDMASGVIRFPAATHQDRMRSQKLKDHFLNWDVRQKIRETTGHIRQHIPDDRAMAFWVGWVKVKELAGHQKRPTAKPRVAEVTRRRWGYTLREEPATISTPTDMLALYHETG